MDERPAKKRRSTVKLSKGRATTPGAESTELASSPRSQQGEWAPGPPNAGTDQTKPDDVPKDSDAKDKDEESEDEDDIDDELLQSKSTFNREAERALAATFTPEQTERYTTFRRAKFPKGTVKKLLQSLLGQNVPESSAIVVAGVSKLFVGEMTEKAREVMQDWGDTGGIRPEHLREAYRRYKHGSTAFSAPGSKKRLFR